VDGSDPGPTVVLELALDPADVGALRRLLAPEAGRPAAAGRLTLRLLDTSDGDFALRGLALVERRDNRLRRVRLERLGTPPGDPWPPGVPPPVLAEAPRATDLPAVLAGLPEVALPGAALPAEAWSGLATVAVATLRRRTLTPADAAVQAVLLRGAVRSPLASLCRLRLTGPADAVATEAHRLADRLRLGVPAFGLTATLLAAAVRPVPPLPAGAPVLRPDLTLGDALAAGIAHLAAVFLRHQPAAAGGETGEPVHQMRVALRRLRSVLGLFNRTLGCPQVEAARAALREVNRCLGPARAWDVFLAETVAAAAAAFPEDRRMARLLAAAGRHRGNAYAALHAALFDAQFRWTMIDLAWLAAAQPWRDAPAAADGLAAFAGEALGRRHKQLRRHGEDIADLPAVDLHTIRLQAKRLRYAAELFAPLFPTGATRRFLRRLAGLQDALGRLNDQATVVPLLDQLATAGGRGYAGGLVHGSIAAAAGTLRSDVAHAWHRWRRTRPFWA
jgi:triphosphatase